MRYGVPVNSEDERRLIGSNVRRYREGMWMSQAEVADALRRSGFEGMYPQTITKIEQGQRVVKLAEGLALARLFRIQPRDLLADGPSASFGDRVALYEAVDRYSEVVFRDLARVAAEADAAYDVLARAVAKIEMSGVEPEPYLEVPSEVREMRPHRDFTIGQLYQLGVNLLKMPPLVMFRSFLDDGTDGEHQEAP